MKTEIFYPSTDEKSKEFIINARKHKTELDLPLLIEQENEMMLYQREKSSKCKSSFSPICGIYTLSILIMRALHLMEKCRCHKNCGLISGIKKN